AENAFTGEVSEAEARFEAAVERPLDALVVDDAGRDVTGARGPELLAWRLGDDGLAATRVGTPPGGAPVSALSLLVGGRSVVAGRSDGTLEVWFRTPEAGGGTALTRVRSFPALAGAVTAIAPSQRSKGFLAL